MTNFSSNTSLIKIAMLAFSCSLSVHTFAAEEHTACVFDVMGAGGEAFSMMRDYALFAQKENVNIKLIPYMDERVAAEDFKAGRCDVATLTGMRGRQFNAFTGSIDAIGAVISNATAKAVTTLMANPKLASNMVYKQYEIGGVFPMGSAYLLVSDRSINTLGKIAGKKMAVLDYDKAQRKLIEKIGAQPVSVEISTMGAKFNNHQVDILGAPAIAFKPMELSKGLGTTGAIVRFPILQLSGNIILQQAKFPEGFGQKSRNWAVAQLPNIMKSISKIENDIPAKYWMDIPTDDQVGYVRIMRDARVSLTKEGIYNLKMMKLIKKVRCKQDPSSFECALNDE